MSLDVRMRTPGERRAKLAKIVLYGLLVIGVFGIATLCVLVMPAWLGYGRDLENNVVVVKIKDAPETRSQAIVGVGNKQVTIPLPSNLKRDPDGTLEAPLEDVISAKNGPAYAGHFAIIENAQVQRLLGNDVVGVGATPATEILVRVPDSAKPTDSTEWGPHLDAKARFTFSGYLRKTPPEPKAAELLRIKDPALENKPLPPVYMEAQTVRMTETKPRWEY